MTRLTMTTDQIVEKLKDTYGENVTTAELKAFCAMNDCGYPTITRRLEEYKSGRGRWNLTLNEKLEQTYQGISGVPAIMDITEVNLVPDKDSNFVSFGNFTDLKQVIKSGIFYPTFITGLSGNGKTFGVEQACAQLGRELIRVNITIETDEDDLLGGFRLNDPRGNTVTEWEDGPVIEALQRGAVLLLDEIDLASNKILCLQSILEGKGVFLKKTGKFVKPTNGFNVIATANTKGKGSDDGRFIGTNVLNEAFLERFAITFEQEYPVASVETKLLKKYASSLGIVDDKFCKYLADWGDIIRKTSYDGGVDEVISTRRLVHILRAYSIFDDKSKAVAICLNRFDDETKQAFMDLYDKIDNEVTFQFGDGTGDIQTLNVDPHPIQPQNSDF